ncbi:MAG: DUF4870 domain-containing protein [archaeon]|mgnify:CR=1 FL=1
MANATTAKTSIGLEENVAGAVAYLLGPITGIALLLMEKDNKFIRFHAMQSTILFIGVIVLNIILTITIIGWILLPFVGLGALVLWILMMYKAYSKEKYKLPIIGDMAEKNS